RSAAAFFYLSLLGGLVGFTTYAWLLRVASPAALSTYAYVNPLVAVLLGWLVAGEELGAGVLVPAGLVVGAVALISLPARGGRMPVSAARPCRLPSPPLRGRGVGGESVTPCARGR